MKYYLVLLLSVALMACNNNNSKKKPVTELPKDTARTDCSLYMEVDTTVQARAARPGFSYTATPISTTEVTLNWKGQGNKTFTIHRHLNGVRTLVSSAARSPYVDKGLTAGTKYVYEVNGVYVVATTYFTPTPPTQPSGDPVVFLFDFDGHTVSGTSWNYAGDFSVLDAGLDSETQSRILDSLRWVYKDYNIKFTADEDLFRIVPESKRQRTVFTQSWEWFGGAGGVSFVNSIGIPSQSTNFVFTSLLAFRFNDIVFATGHEDGHALGLPHDVDSCNQAYGKTPNWMAGNYQFPIWVRTFTDKSLSATGCVYINQPAIIRQTTGQ